MKLVMVGAPLSGKGSISDLIAKDYNIVHISTGDIFRELVTKDTPLALKVKEYMDKAVLVPDEITCQVVTERLKEPDLENGFVLDGFPRTVEQAKYFAENVTLDQVIVIDEKLEVLVERAKTRRICPNCKRIYNIKRENITDNTCIDCRTALVSRKDDNEETVTKRYYEYLEKTEPVIEFYEEQGIVSHLTGGELYSNYADVKKILEKMVK